MVLKVIDNGSNQELLPTMALQKELVERKVKGCSNDYLVLLEHAPSYSVSKSAESAKVDFMGNSLNLGAPCLEVNRSGKTIFHSAGQLSIYPIFDLRARNMDAKVFTGKLEFAIMKALRVLGLVSYRGDGAAGRVWVGSEKKRRNIASIGLSLRQWISYNGIWLNVFNEPSVRGETSIEAELAEIDASRLNDLRYKNLNLGTGPEESLMREVKRQIVYAFQKEFGFKTADTVQVKDVLPAFARPSWLSARRPQGMVDFLKVKSILDKFEVTTSCEEKHCPNLGDCWSKRCVSFSIPQNDLYLEKTHIASLRIASYGLSSGQWDKAQELDETEPLRFAEAVKQLGLKHVVFSVPATISSRGREVYRFCRAVKQIKETNPKCRIEAEVSGLQGLPQYGYGILSTGVIDVVSCNLPISSTVTGGISETFLNLLYWAKKFDKHATTKAGLLIGAGETMKDVISILKTLRCMDCDMLSIGQYLQPSSSAPKHHRFVTLEEFAYLKELALEAGFKEVVSEPLARNSYFTWWQPAVGANKILPLQQKIEAGAAPVGEVRRSLADEISVEGSGSEKTSSKISHISLHSMVHKTVGG